MVGPPSLQGIVFDLDGVLVDSEPLHSLAIRRAVQDHGLAFSDEEYEAELMGLDDVALIARLFAMRGRTPAQGQGERIAESKTAHLVDLLEHGVETCPGALPLLQEAAGAMPVGLCSGSRRVEVEALLDGLGPDVRGVFGALITGDDVRASKPDPEGYLEAVRALDLDPACCLAIEDTPTGLTAARLAGMRVLAVDLLDRPGRLAAADRVVRSLKDVTLSDLREIFG